MPIIEMRVDARILDILMKIDVDLAAATRQKGCPHCGSDLHSARYPRKGRTGDAPPPEGWGLFHGLCCSNEGCRRRVRPPSVRFAGRSPHAPLTLAVVRLVRSGGSERGIAALSRLVQVSERTVRRWLGFWHRANRTTWWRELAGRFSLSGLGLKDFWDRHLASLAIHEAQEQLSRLLTGLWLHFITDGVGVDPPAEDA